MSARRYYPLAALIVSVVLTTLAVYHIWQLTKINHWFIVVNSIMFIWIVGSIVLSHSNRRWNAPEDFVYGCRTTVIIPVHNEDPRVFAQLMEALDAQTRLPDKVHFVDDHSGTNECQKLFDDWSKRTPIRELQYSYLERQMHKRRAQARAFLADTAAEVYVTVDSDTVLDKRAVEEVIKPFYEARVMAVAGLLLGLNQKTNLLTRLVDLSFVSSFTNGRAAWSAVKSVAVSCGGLAAYRGSVVRKYQEEYVNQKVGSNTIPTGDDRMMTGYGALEGWTIYQESAVGYTLLPENIGHLTRQRIRWWRSFFWGGYWLICRFPISRLIWWLVVWQFVSFVLFSIIFPIVLIIHPIMSGDFPWEFFLYIFLLSYVRPIRYLSVKREDLSFRQQLGIYALSPLSTLLQMYLSNALQYVGLFTMTKSGWGTRGKVEQFTVAPEVKQQRARKEQLVPGQHADSGIAEGGSI